MALLDGLPEEYSALISALDAIDEEESKLNFKFLKYHIIQEEQRISMRTKSAEEKAESDALVSERLVNSVVLPVADPSAIIANDLVT